MTDRDLVTVRHELHQLAELSGAERETATFLAVELSGCRPDVLVEGLGGHGLAAVFAGAEPGPTVLVRCDMDGLPLLDRNDLSYSSRTAGTAHKCGHDGHMTMLLGLARELSAERPSRGRAVLLFQPAEETGAGARAVLDDPKFAPLRPDLALAIHNLPGEPLGTVVWRNGTFASASRGLTINLQGVSAHAAEPAAGRSPALAAAGLVQALSALPQIATALGAGAKATVVGIDVGGPAFGTSPGTGAVMVTLRAWSDDLLDTLADECGQLAAGFADAYGLTAKLVWSEEFPATVNDPSVTAAAVAGAAAAGLATREATTPFAWSEDFGHFTGACPGALLGLGSGLEQPPLHHPDYDFPDELVPIGVNFWQAALTQALASDLGEGGRT